MNINLLTWLDSLTEQHQHELINIHVKSSSYTDITSHPSSPIKHSLTVSCHGSDFFQSKWAVPGQRGNFMRPDEKRRQRRNKQRGRERESLTLTERVFWQASGGCNNLGNNLRSQRPSSLTASTHSAWSISPFNPHITSIRERERERIKWLRQMERDE